MPDTATAEGQALTTGPGQQAAPALRMQDVTIAFRRRDGSTLTVVESMDLAVAPGQVVCLVGRSGCGKTSLLRVACGLLRPSRGSVSWEGQDLCWHDPARLAAQRSGFLSLVCQDSPGLDELSAVDNVLLGLAPSLLRRQGSSHPQARREALRLLERLGVTDPNTRLRQMSGGERQRVSLARALLAKPRLACLDEPTSALDHATAKDVLDLVREHAAAGNAVLVAAHDPLMKEAADRVIDMAQHVPLS